MCLFNGGVDGAFHGLQEPQKPLRDVQTMLAHVFQHVVVVLPVAQDGCRHTVEALGCAIGACQEHIGECACQAAVAIVKRVNVDKPKMGYGGFQHGVGGRLTVEPIQEQLHLKGHILRRRGFIMYLLLSHGAAYNLHRFRALSPCSYGDGDDTASSQGKQCGMPVEQPLFCQGSVGMLHGIQHHLYHTFGIVVGHG